MLEYQILKLKTNRLRLRALTLDDCPRIRKLLSNVKISELAPLIPYPYPDGSVAKWIAPQAAQWAAKRGVMLSIEKDGTLIGSIGLEGLHERRIELRYWLGVEAWGNGYMSAAVGAIIPFGFKHLPIDLIHARCLSHNPASARVLEKNEFTEVTSHTKSVRQFERKQAIHSCPIQTRSSVGF